MFKWMLLQLEEEELTEPMEESLPIWVIHPISKFGLKKMLQKFKNLRERIEFCHWKRLPKPKFTDWKLEEIDLSNCAGNIQVH